MTITLDYSGYCAVTRHMRHIPVQTGVLWQRQETKLFELRCTLWCVFPMSWKSILRGQRTSRKDKCHFYHGVGVSSFRRTI